MVPALKSEFKKLLTVRSTYFATLLIIVLSCLFTFLGTSQEYQNQPNSQNNSARQSKENQPPPLVKTRNLPDNKMESNVLNATGAALPIAVVVLLLMAHEFRYNTITYTLTSSNRRSRVLLAKILTGAVYVLIATFLTEVLTVAVTYVAVHVKDLYLPPQTIDWVSTSGRLLGYIMGFSLFGLAIITLVKNQVAGIVALFILPSIDGLASLLLVHNKIEPSKYLPFSALTRFGMESADSGISPGSLPSVMHAGVVFLVYLAAVWLAAWTLFLRNDATN